MDSIDQRQEKTQLVKIIKAFYDKVFVHPELSLLFSGIFRDRLEKNVLDFMYSAMSGENDYNGMNPIDIHKHMFITEELFEVRKNLLIETFNEFENSDNLLKRWLKIDDAFKEKIVKKDISECMYSSKKQS